METVRIKRIKFGSYFKLVMLMSLGMGMLFGLFLFIMSLFGGNVYANLGSIVLTGVTAGVVNLFLGPLIFVFFGLFTALVSFLPFKLLLKLLKRITLSIEFDNMASEMQSEFTE